MTANAPKSQTSTVSGVTTQTFDSFTAGKYTSLNVGFGTLKSNALGIVVADQYGGAGGAGRYFSVGVQSGNTSATLTLNSPQAYFGFWWSAADSANSISFLSQGKTVASYNSASAFGALSSSYLGNPNGLGDNGEKFAYFNFLGTNGSTFDQIVFSNGNTNSGFESDNWSVSETPITGGYPGMVVVAEPGSMVLMAIGAVGIVTLFLRKQGFSARGVDRSTSELAS